ncbi:MAG TPA: ABC transporter permease/substrate-binding protein [Thermoanaerobaculia bacterium]|nr:ABC transporter permease/substrate-binding protein [Thermoanaerobaculia bacterium]
MARLNVEQALSQLPPLLAAHLQLAAAALLVGALVAFPLGVWATRRPRLLAPVLLLASVIQTVPGLALLAVMVPLLVWIGALVAPLGVGVRAIGFLPAFLALTLYSLLPMLRNTVAGIRGVDPAVREAARGVGMTDRQQLLRVELPLALPTLVAGLRTATVWTVGMATLSTPVGAPSLGNLIFAGLQTRDTAAVLVGCAAAATLALVLDGLVRAVEIGLTRRRRGITIVAAAALLLLLAGALLPLARRSEANAAAQRPVTFGAKPFTEQLILAELMAAQVQARTSAPTRILPALGSTVAWDALRAGTLDAYVDYTGTLWATVLHRKDQLERHALLRETANELAHRFGVEVVGPLGFENTYALAMTDARASALGVHRISDLAPHAASMEVGGDYELFGRPEWRAIRGTYGLHFSAERAMDPSLMYQAIAAGEVDLIGAYSTDGRIAALHLRLLEDDRHVIPPYDAVLLARPRLRGERPQVWTALRELVGRIDQGTMQRLNLAVDEQHRPPGEAARAFLRQASDRPQVFQR